MKPKTLVLFAVAAGCGLLALLGFQAMQGAQPKAEVETVKVLVVTTPIEAGQALNEDNVRFRAVPVDSVPKDAVLSDAQYLDRSALIPMMAGDTVSMSKLTEPGVSGTSTRIPKGWRVYTISANDSITASGMLHAGDRVDVLVTYKARTAKGTVSKTKALLEYVEVFATDDRTNTRAADAEAAKAKNVSLLLTPDQVNYMILAKSKGMLELSWRHRMDDQLVQAGEVDEALLEELQGTVGLYDDRPLYEMGSEGEFAAYEPETASVPEPASTPAAFLNSVAEPVAPPTPAPPVVAAQPGWTVQVFNGNQPEVQQFAITEATEVTPSVDPNWVSTGLKSLFGSGTTPTPTVVN